MSSKEGSKRGFYYVLAFIYIHTHTFLTTHQDYDTMQVRVCV